MRTLFAVALLCSSVALAQSEGLDTILPASSTVQGDLTVNGDAGVAGNALFLGRLVVDGGTVFNSDVTISGDLLPSVNGGASDIGNTSLVWTNVRGYYFTSSAGVGSNGFSCSVNGCRIDFGAGANDHATSDGTKVVFAGSVNMGSGALTVGQAVTSPEYNLSTATATAKNSTSTNPWTFDDAQGVAWLGVPTASLTACNSTAPNVSGGMRGSINYDTTTNTYKYCNGTAYTNVAGFLTGSATIDFAAIAATSSSDHGTTIAVTGATVGKPCKVGAEAAAYVAGVDFGCRVSAANAVTVRAQCVNGTTGTCDPASAAFSVEVTP